jgi:uncharacterized protein YndB with AHSA1/START domain
MAQSTTQDRPRLHLTRRYPVAPEKVWRAWTEPQALSAWFGPGEANSVTRVELDLRTGGAYTIGFQTQDGEQHQVSGVYQEVVANRKLCFTWAWQSTPERVSLVTIELRPTAQGCELDFRHDRFFDEVARDNHERGWSATLEKLDAFVRA